MKRITSILCLAVVAAVLTISCSSQKAVMTQADKVRADHVTMCLEERLYKIDVSRAYPASEPSMHLNHPYFISVMGDRVESMLPYYGRVYSVPFGGGEGLRFEAPISDYKMTSGKNGKRKVTFKARTNEDSYNFAIEIYPMGEVNVHVSSVQKQSISFSGQMDLNAEFEIEVVL